MRRTSLGVCVCFLWACGDSAGGSDGSTGGEEASSGGVVASTSGEAPTSGGTGVVAETGEGTTIAGSTSGSTSGGESTGEDSTTGKVVEIEEALDGIDGLEWEEQDSEIDGCRFFLLYYQQPADHAKPDGQQFTQHMMLHHCDPTAPTVISTEGYFIYPWYQALSEPAALLKANQLIVEHRWFSDSRPDPADWKLLTIEQAAGDHHRITRALQDAIYHAPWVATGASKSGMTSTYFRRFYPDDVAATIPYVAPLSFSDEDPRYWDYLQQIDPACEAALREFRRELLLRREPMLERIQDEGNQMGYSYEFIDMDHALEVVALEASWAFWQYGSADDCPDVPNQGSSDTQIWNFLQDVNPVNGMSDDRMFAFEPYFFQAGVQLGAPQTVEDDLADLLMYPGFDVVGSFVVPGPGKEMVYDPAPMLDIKDWMAEEATAMLFVYGENDPWTGGQYEANEAHDVYKFIAPGENHGAKIADLTPADRAVAFERLEAWTGVKPISVALPPTPRRDRLGMLP